MPFPIEDMGLDELFEYVDENTPTPEEWNQNPLLIQSKLNELAAAARKSVQCVRSGYTGATALGKVYKLTGSVLSLAAHTDASLDCYPLGIGTGNVGEIQDGDELIVPNMGFALYPCKVWLGAAGVLVNTPPESEWVAPFGLAKNATLLKIEINRFNFYRVGTGF